MNRHAVQVIGWLVSLIIKQERERWTTPITLRPDLVGIAGRLRDLPISTQNLFPGGLELIQAEALELRERKELVAQVLPPTAETSTKPTKAAKKKRSASTASAEKQPAPTPPAATQDVAAEGAVPKKWGDTLAPADKGKGRGRGKRK